ncbi:MAG: cyclic nucleotide-binding domain-containing protein [Deltaproteobacteria bacterium]|nr:cyclic nucleotide-binding domain-containing protein [Deltaproteobacteria bacterium]
MSLQTLWLQNPIFAAAGAKACAQLAQRCPPLEHGAGRPVVRAGEPADHLHVVLSGTVRVFHRSPDGRELVVKLLRAPVAFGEMELLHHLAFLESVDALDDALIARIPEAVYLEFLLAHPAAMLEQLRAVAGAFCVAARNEQQILAPLDQRIANLLLAYGDLFGRPTAGGGVLITQPLSQEQIAHSLGVVRRSVALILSSWVKAQTIAKQGEHYALLAPERLEKLAAPIRNSLAFRLDMALDRLTPEAPATVRAHVEVTSPAELATGFRYDVRRELLVGRQPPARLLIVDEHISRQHCRVFLGTTGGRYWVEDLESANGTLLNGRPLRRGVLRDGDRIQLGPVELLFTLTEAH